MSPLERHTEQVLTMRAYLMGARWFLASRALEFARERTTGFRKDGVTPAFLHPLSVGRFVRDLTGNLLYPEETLAAAFLHDLIEDDAEITQQTIADMFTPCVGAAVWTLSKKSRGMVKSPEVYFEALARDPIASIVKGVDRHHNLFTSAVFPPEKRKAYAEEVDTYFRPMLTKAGCLFPEQFMAYELVALALRGSAGS